MSCCSILPRLAVLAVLLSGVLWPNPASAGPARTSTTAPSRGPEHGPPPGGWREGLSPLIPEEVPQSPITPLSQARPAAPPPPPAKAPSPGGARPPTPSAAERPSDPGRALLEHVEALTPKPRGQDMGGALFMVLAALLCLLASRNLGRLRGRLAPDGLLPRVLGGLQTAFRILALFFTLLALTRSLPSSVWSALPWALLAGAAAVGWSARDLLPDLVGGGIILIERRIRRGQWISGQSFSGRVERVGLRSTILSDAGGRSVAVPNRKLVTGLVTAETAAWPTVQTTVRIAEGHSPLEIHRALEELARLSPWLAPRAEVTVLRDASDPHAWIIRTRVLEARFASTFESALHERVEELYPPPAPLLSFLSGLPRSSIVPVTRPPEED